MRMAGASPATMAQKTQDTLATLAGDGRRQLGEPLRLLLAQRDLHCPRGLLGMVRFRRAGDRDDGVAVVGDQPREGDLADRRVMGGCDLADAVDQWSGAVQPLVVDAG